MSKSTLNTDAKVFIPRLLGVGIGTGIDLKFIIEKPSYTYAPIGDTSHIMRRILYQDINVMACTLSGANDDNSGWAKKDIIRLIEARTVLLKNM